MSEPKNRRPRFSLSTILWMLVAVSCFFAGKYAGRERPVSPNQLTLSVGESTTVVTSHDIPELMLEDPNICGIKPLAPNSFELVGFEPGTTRFTLTKSNGGTVDYTIVVPEELFD